MTSPTLSDVSRPKAGDYGCALDDRLFRLAVGPGRELMIRTAPLEDESIRTESSPEEFIEGSGKSFARSRFSDGEGLFRAHVEGASPSRFWDSRNVSVVPAEPGEFPEITLLPATAQVEASATTGLRLAYDDVNGSVYMCEGTVLRRTDDPTAASPSFSDDDPHLAEGAVTVEDVTVLGDEVYAALGVNGIHKKTSGVWAHWGDTPGGAGYLRVWSVKGRIVASDGTALYEVTASGPAPTALKTLASGLEWTDVADGGAFILASATDGYVYAFGTDTGAMVLAAQSFFEGEKPQCVGQSQGVIAVGTVASNVGRLWVGELASTGQLANMRVVKQWGVSGTATDQSPRDIIGTRDALFTAVPDGTDTYLWRYDLSTAGLSRHLTVDPSGLCLGLAVVAGLMFASIEGNGLYRQASTYAAEGWLMGPLGDFFTASDKSWIGARMETGLIESGMTAKLYYTTDPDALGDVDSASWVLVDTRTTGTGDPGEHPLTGVVARSLAGMVKLTPTTEATGTPSVRSFSFRAYPSSGDPDVIVTIPVNVSDWIERPGVHRRRIPGRGAREYAALTAFETKPVTLRLFRPAETIRGHVKEVATPVQALTSRGSVTMVSQVTVVGRRAGEGVTTGVGSFGTYHLFGTTPTFGSVA